MVEQLLHCVKTQKLWVRFGGSQHLNKRLSNTLAVALLITSLAFTIRPAQAYPVAPSAQEAATLSPLLRAAYQGKVQELKDLIRAGQTLSSTDTYGRTAVHLAAYARRHDVLRVLARAGAKLETFEKDRYDAVTIVGILGDEETLRVLLALGASAQLITSIHYGTALIASAHHGHPGVVRQLIAAGAPLDHVNILHWNAMIEAVVLGDGGQRHQQVLKALLDAGANTRLTDRQGQTPLDLARSREFTAMVKMLEAAQAGK